MGRKMVLIVSLNLTIILLLSLIDCASSNKYNIETNDERNLPANTFQNDFILEKSYHGLIKENETHVEITPLIKVNEEKVCDFRILKKLHHEIPFRIQLVNNIGVLEAKRTLNCEKRRGYHFEIIAILCDGTHSLPANVHISVIDINEYAPAFLQPSYVTEVDEGKLYQEIIRVEATDKDCTPPYGDICKYQILNSEEPFTIDNEGSIKNTEPLSYKVSHNHILQVIAYDCAMKQSESVMTSIKVRRVCEERLTGIPERIDFTVDSMESVILFPNANIELCDTHCEDENMNIHVSVSLKTKHISFGCDRDISKCSKNNKLYDVLPKQADWTKNLNFDEGSESVIHFDGSSGAIVPPKIVNNYDFGMNPFSIVTMLKHTSSYNLSKHAKEHIICSADDHKMNRHHMALFIRNCRLILLIRKNFNEGDLNMFSPAEWRWKIPQVCDNEWHHYVLNVDLPKIELFIDGAKFENSAEDRHSNPEVIDDWPLHAAHGVNTTLTVGACFQGSENRLKHGFNGYISEIKLALNGVLSSEDVRCGTSCAEHLIPPPEKYLESELEVQSNSQLNEIFIEGTNKSNIELLLANVQYVNKKKFPTIGRRNIEMGVTLTCPNKSAVRLSTVETYIMVNALHNSNFEEPNLFHDQIIKISDFKAFNSKISENESPKNKFKVNSELRSSISDAKDWNDDSKMLQRSSIPRISIRGNSNHLVSYPDIKNGVHILASINISVHSDNQSTKNPHTIDSCSVSVFPSLNPDHEDITLDNDYSISTIMEIKTNINKDGVEMNGYDTIQNYLNVLKSLIYINKKPAYYLNRVFKLSCSQEYSRFKSAEFVFTLTVLHPKQQNQQSFPPSLSSLNSPTLNSVKTGLSTNKNTISKTEKNNQQLHLQNQHDSNVFAHAMIHSHDVEEPQSKSQLIIHRAQTSHPTMLIIVVCILFVILLCGISIVRIRNNTNKYLERQPCQKITTNQLDWDDSAMTIIINPMQNNLVSDESSESEHSDSDEEEVSNGKYRNINQLEWDNSTM